MVIGTLPFLLTLMGGQMIPFTHFEGGHLNERSIWAEAVFADAFDLRAV